MFIKPTRGRINFSYDQTVMCNKIEGQLEKFIRFDSELNAIDFLEKAVFFYKTAKSDNSYYKWLIISLFGALYGFAVSASRGTSNSSSKKDITYKDKKGFDILKHFDDVLKLCQNNSFMKKGSNSKALVLSEKQQNSIQILKNELRNNFEHFLPNFSWSIEFELVESIIPDIMEVIRFLVFETNTYGFLDEDRKVKMLELLSESNFTIHNRE